MSMWLFLDTADIAEMTRWQPNVNGFTTNPTLMRKAGVEDYEAFAHDVLEIADGLPVSFEVLSEESHAVVEEARRISSWGPNVYVKVPVLYLDAITACCNKDIPVNVTAICDPKLVPRGLRAGSIVSVFAGRIADTGRPAYEIMRHLRSTLPNDVLLLWASTREVYNIREAELAGCDIITVTPAVLEKYLNWAGRDLMQLTRETVEQFTNDAKQAGYTL